MYISWFYKYFLKKIQQNPASRVLKPDIWLHPDSPGNRLVPNVGCYFKFYILAE